MPAESRSCSASDQVDGVLLTGYFGGYSTEQSNLTGPELAAAHQMADAVAAQGKPLVVQTIYPDSPASQVLRAVGHPGAPGRRSRVRGAGRPRRARDGRPRRGAPGPCAARHRHVVRRGAGAVRRRRDRLPGRRVGHRRRRAGGRARHGLGFPVVLKATGRLHKSEGGGVVVGLADRDEARAAYADLVTRLAPPAVSVEAMADLADGVELIVGSVRDPKFGSVVMVGLGGDPHRGARRHRLRHRAGVGRRRSRAPAVLAGRSGAPRRAGTAAGRPGRAGRAWSPASRASRPPTPSSSSWSSTRCSPVPAESSRWMRGSSWADGQTVSTSRR